MKRNGRFHHDNHEILFFLQNVLNFCPNVGLFSFKIKMGFPPDFYSCAGENYLQTLENTDFFRLQKIFIIIFCIYANKSCYNNKNLDILPILAYIH